MHRNRPVLYFAVAVAVALLSAAYSPAAVPEKAAAKTPTAAEAKAFVDAAEKKLMELAVEASRAGWVQSTYITDDTEVLAAKANERVVTGVRSPLATSGVRSPLATLRQNRTTRRG